MDFQSRWWIENRRRRWLEHVDNVRDRTNNDEEDEENDEEDKCGDLYWLYAMLAMLLELESSIEESAFQPSGERERRRWRRECEYLEEAVRESIGLEAAPHRILMGREREQARTAAFGRGERDEEDGPNASELNNNSSSSGNEDEDEDEEEEGERMRRLRRQRHSIARNTNNNNSASDLHPVSFRVERRESVPLRVVETDEADEADEAEEMFSNYSTANADAQTVGRRSSVIQFSRDSPRTRMRHVLENNNNNSNNNNDATPNIFARPTDILETVYSSFDADINARSLREAHMRIARAAREGLDASTHLATIISHLTTQRTTTTTSARSTSTNTPPSMVNRGYCSSSISRRRLDFDEDEDENDEQHSLDLKNEITRLKDQIDKLEKASTCVICYSNPRACALLPCCHFTTCLECANRSRERFVEQANEDEEDEEEDAGEDENDDDINNNNNRKVKKNEVFFRCPTCRANVTGVLQVFPP